MNGSADVGVRRQLHFDLNVARNQNAKLKEELRLREGIRMEVLDADFDEWIGLGGSGLALEDVAEAAVIRVRRTSSVWDARRLSARRC